MEPPFVVDLVDEAGKVGGDVSDVGEVGVLGDVDRLDLERLEEALEARVVVRVAAPAHRATAAYPYALELNDRSTTIGRQTTGRDFATMIVDQFDDTLASADQPVVMSVVLHSFIYGQPFRLRAILEALKHIVRQSSAVWLTTPGAIYAEVHHARADIGV